MGIDMVDTRPTLNILESLKEMIRGMVELIGVGIE
jgi:hypothetical protein